MPHPGDKHPHAPDGDDEVDVAETAEFEVSSMTTSDMLVNPIDAGPPKGQG